MGPLTFPKGTRIAIDAQIIIYSVERHVVYWPKLESMWDEAAAGNLKLISSELSVLECLIIPERRRDAVLLAEFSHTFSSPHDLTLAPIDRTTLRQAAQLRAKYQWLKSPDSIHISTAIQTAADVFLTNDVALLRISEVRTFIASQLP